jgi:fumarylacetoacetase
MISLNHTHDPHARSWVISANDGKTDFPIQNLPYAVMRHTAAQQAWWVGMAIGNYALHLPALVHTGLLTGSALTAAQACADGELNPLMALGAPAWQALRHAVFALLSESADESIQTQVQSCLIPQSQLVFRLPAQIGDYTDFYTSIYHATNVGKLFRPDNPLLPNYRWVPIGYHGRSSSIQVSGHQIQRPYGQTLAAGASQPELTASKRLDWELELGVFMGSGNNLGTPIALAQAEQYVFGICLLNDWSARDLQAWEYQPLGPFLSKSFATTISPWVVSLEALAPYRVPMERPDAQVDLPYLHSNDNQAHGGLDIRLRVGLRSTAMQAQQQPVHWVCNTSYRHAYWTFAQMVTHHTVNGCNLRPGDLLGTGTLSGPSLDQAGALLELTQGGKQPLSLPNGETRTFLLDGDEVTLEGHCEREGYPRLGFGTCVATIAVPR